MRRVVLSPLLLLAFATTIQAQSASAIQPGSYELEITFGGGVTPGLLEISTRHDSTIVLLHVGEHDSPVRPTHREGNHLTLDSTVSGVAIHYELEFRGDSVSGPFSYQGDIGSVAGRRRTTRKS